MAKPDIFDHVIEFLEYRKRQGIKTAEIALSTRQALFKDTAPVEGDAGEKTAVTDRPQAVAMATGAADTAIPQASPTAAARPGKASSSPAAASGKKPIIVTEADPRDWEELIEAVNTCKLCGLCATRTHAVFGEGAIDAPIMFIGEGPGYHEDQSGRPFVGRAGKLLTRMIKAMQFGRESVFITNIVKCRPPGNRNPQEAEAASCMPYLNRQIDIIKPKIIVLLGAVPLSHLLGLSGITRIHGNFYEYRGITVMPTYHPSFLLRSPKRKAEAWEDLQNVMRHVGKDPEETMRAMQAGKDGG